MKTAMQELKETVLAMKLYTEEQVRKAIDLGRDYYDGWDRTEKDIINSLTPIELPSDEEIVVESFVFNPIKLELEDDWDKNKQYRDEFIEGAKWMKEQILNQNK
jgi:hypothetical protein